LKLLAGLIFLAALNTTLFGGVLLIAGLPMRPLDWFLMLWPWGLVGLSVNLTCRGIRGALIPLTPDSINSILG
jgi:hypothetical protein